MSRVSRTTIEKRQLLTIIGTGLEKEHSIARSHSPIRGSPLQLGCGCEAFAPVTEASRVAFPDGSFPAIVQTSCLVTYQHAEVAARLRRDEEETQAAAFAAAAEEEHESSFLNKESDHDDDPLNLDSSPAPRRSNFNNNNSTTTMNDSSHLIAPAHLSYGSASPNRRETTLNPRANSMPVYVPDDAYDLEVDALEAKEAKMAAAKALGLTPKKSSSAAAAQNEAEERSAEGGDTKSSTTPNTPPKKKKRVDVINVAPSDVVSEVWTANADGTISIRNPVNGRHAKFQPRIPAFGRLSQGITNGGGNCFVTAMLQVRDLVFAGYVDGMVRVFNAISKELIFEKRKHASTITCIAQWKDNVVFTGSDDFRIMMWRVGVERSPDANLKEKILKQKEKEKGQSEGTDEKQAAASLGSPLFTTVSPVGGNPALVVNVPAGGGSVAANAVTTLAADHEGPSFLHQLQGHASRVLALHVEGDYLYSGGDEGLVKCWDIRTHTEVVGSHSSKAGSRFPINAHPHGGVRDITTCQSVLITAGKGGVALYDLESCDEMKRFTNFSDVNRILVDPTSLVLWVCCSNTGTITLIDLYTFREIGVIADFSAATIKSISTVVTSPAARLFLGSSKGGGLSVAYCEGGPMGMRQDYSPINAETEAKYKTLDVLRDEIFANEANLKSYRNLLWSIRDTDQYHKHKAVQVFERGATFQQQKLFLERCILFVIKHRHNSRQLTIASALERSCEHRLRFTALLKWFLFRRSARDARFKEFVTNSLSREHEKQLIGRQLQNVMSYMVQAQRLHNRKLIVPVLEKYQTRRCVINFFIKWRRWVQEKHAKEKLGLMVGYLSNRSQRATKMAAFVKLSKHASDAHVATVRISGCTNLERGNKLLLLREYFRKWSALKADLHQSHQLDTMGDVVERRGADLPLMRRYYSILWQFANKKARERQEKKLATITDRITFIEQTIADEEKAKEKMATDDSNNGPSSSSEVDEIARLEEEIARLELEAAEAAQINAQTKETIKELSLRETALLLSVGTAPHEVTRAKAVPKRRADDGEEPAEVGAVEGTQDLPLLVPSSGNNSFAQSNSYNSKYVKNNSTNGGFAKVNSGGTYGRSASSLPQANGEPNQPRAERPLTYLDAFSGDDDRATNGVNEDTYLDKFTAFATNTSRNNDTDDNYHGENNDLAAHSKEDFENYFACDKVVAVIKASGFNMRTGRAEIARRSAIRRGAASSHGPSSQSVTSTSPLSPARGPASIKRGASTAMTMASKHAAAVAADLPPEAAFGSAMYNLYAAVRPLAKLRDSLEFDEQWDLDEERVAAKPNLLRKALGAAHDVVIAWEYIRNRNDGGEGGVAGYGEATPRKGRTPQQQQQQLHQRLQKGSNGQHYPHTIKFADIPNADILIKNTEAIYGLFSKSLATTIENASVDLFGSPLSSAAASRSTPLQTPTNSRNSSPTTTSSRRAATPSSSSAAARRAGSVGPSSPAPKRMAAATSSSSAANKVSSPSPAPSASASAVRRTPVRINTSSTAGAGATAAAQKAAKGSSTAAARSTSPSVSRPSKSSTGTGATGAAQRPSLTRTIGGGAKPSSSTPAPSATTAGLKKTTSAAATTRPTTPRAGSTAVGAGSNAAATRRSTTPTATASRTTGAKISTTANSGAAASRVRNAAK